MSKEPPIKTMEIPVMLEELSTAEEALRHEKLKAGEKIEELRRSYHEGLIPFDQMKAEIEEVRERLQQLLIDTDILT